MCLSKHKCESLYSAKCWYVLLALISIFMVIQFTLNATDEHNLGDEFNSLVKEGYAQIHSGQIETALLSFKRALEEDADNLKALLGQAMIYAEQARHKDAFTTYDLITKQYPQNALAWNGRGLAAFNLENFDEALASFKMSTADQPNNGFFYESLAWTQMCRGEFEEAAESAKKAVLMYGQAGETSLYPLLIAYFSYHESGDAYNALRMLKYANKNKSLNQWPGPVIDYLNNEIDEAAMISFVTSHSEETEAHAYIGFYMRLLGKTDAAQRHLNWVCNYGNKKGFEYTFARTLQPQSKFATVN